MTHPRHFDSASLSKWPKECAGLQAIAPTQFDQLDILLQTAKGHPLPCPELMITMEDDLPDQAEWAACSVDCYSLASSPIGTLGLDKSYLDNRIFNPGNCHLALSLLNYLTKKLAFKMNMELIKPTNIESAISDLICLFSLPEIYLRIRELMEDEHSELDDFARVLITDPNLTASVLKVVNSAYFGFTGQIESIPRALNLLGIGPLHDLVLSISAVGCLSMPNDVIELSRFWRRSIYCAVLSKLIGEDKKIKDAGNLFVIGLLHEIGHLLFFFKFPDQSKAALRESEHSHRLLYETEQDLFTIHYGQAGQLLMKAWNLPQKFQVITEFHPEPKKASQYSLETAIVHIAHYYAWAKDSGENAASIIDAVAWQLVNSSPEEMNELIIKADPISYEMEKMIVR